SIVLLSLVRLDCARRSSFFFFFHRCCHHRDLHSFPTRRSSDLGPISNYHGPAGSPLLYRDRLIVFQDQGRQSFIAAFDTRTGRQDRKSTRLNSSHVKISYAVFCLKKKSTTEERDNVTSKHKRQP